MARRLNLSVNFGSGRLPSWRGLVVTKRCLSASFDQSIRSDTIRSVPAHDCSIDSVRIPGMLDSPPDLELMSAGMSRHG